MKYGAGLLVSTSRSRRSAIHGRISGGSIRRRGGGLRPRLLAHFGKLAQKIVNIAIFLKWQNLSNMEVDRRE